MKMYVGNLSRTMTEDVLRQAFEQYGEVMSVKIIKDRETGELRGFGFVEMADAEKAQDAMAALNGAELEGQRLRVNEARPQEDRRGGSSSFRGPRGPRQGGSSSGSSFGGNRRSSGGFNRYEDENNRGGNRSPFGNRSSFNRNRSDRSINDSWR